MKPKYPITFSIDYPDRVLNRLTTFFRIFVAIPILIVLSTVSATGSTNFGSHHSAITLGAGLLFMGPLLLILFRQKYPKWWFNWNLELLRFSNRVGIYLALMDDKYPSTDEEQSVHLDIKYPDVVNDLNRWLPLVKWFLAIPHYFVLFFLNFVAVIFVVLAWFAILITGRYPKSLFDYVLGVIRWNNRVIGYALILVTDEYPPFNFKP